MFDYYKDRVRRESKTSSLGYTEAHFHFFCFMQKIMNNTRFFMF